MLTLQYMVLLVFMAMVRNENVSVTTHNFDI